MVDRTLAEMCRLRPDLCRGDWCEIGFYTVLTLLVIALVEICYLRRG